jgi:hypothetical protein
MQPIKMPSADEMKAMGISVDRLGPSETYSWPELPSGEAKGVVAKVTLAAVLSGTTPMNPAAIPALEQIGIKVESADRAPWNVRLSTPVPDGFVAVRVPSGAHNAVLTQPERKNEAAVDLVKAESVLISGPHGDVLATADSHGVTVSAVSGVVVEPTATIEAPALQWLSETQSSDHWLHSEVSQLLQRGGSWAQVVAAAFVARYLEPASNAVAKRWIEATLACQTVPALAAPRQWARQLRPAQVRTVQELARAEATRLALMLDDVADTAVPDEGPWQSVWLDVCHGRDDLEGICTLLREASAAEALQTSLVRLDKTGRMVRSVLPTAFIPNDERTRRASRVSPDSWWSTSE